MSCLSPWLYHQDWRRKIYNKLQRLPKRMVHSFFSWTRIIGRVSTHPATEPRLVDWVEQEIVQADWSLHYLCWDRQTTTNHNPRQETAPARRIDQYTWRFCKELLCFSCEVAFLRAAKGLHQTNMGPEPNKRLARTPTGAKLTTWWKPGEILTFPKKNETKQAFYTFWIWIHQKKCLVLKK